MEGKGAGSGTAIRYLTAVDTAFHRTSGHMLNVTAGEDEFPGVHLHCSFPHTMPRAYISVRTADNKEIGIIRSLDDFSEITQRLLEDQIRLRYFAPKITRVVQIKHEFGYTYWDTETTAGICRFTVKGGGGSVKFVSENKLLVTDVDGNRFEVPDTSRLSVKEFGMIEMCM
jgi:hypothetical protein